MLRFRPVVLEDAKSLLEIYSYYVNNTVISFEMEPPTLEDFTGRIKMVIERFPWIVAEQDSLIVGYAYATAFKPRAAYFPAVETTIYLRVDACRRGLGRLLYTKLLDLVKLQGCYTALAGITLPNEASEAVHRSVGFQPIGIQRAVGYKNNKWHDVGQVRSGGFFFFFFFFSMSICSIKLNYDHSTHTPLPLPRGQQC